ncbi:MAG TPA: hypothetical protein VKV74_16790 [Bryobacteraceae bacterium]|nr:hypothetical protein [Bryobacteraceae bacterium]
MRLLAFFLLAGLAFAQNGPRVVYSKSFPGSSPPYVAITLEQGGAAAYTESKDDDPETFALESGVASAIFDLAAKLDHFKRPLESGLKVANMGAKTFRWENGAENFEARFNYSLDENARALQDWFEKIGESERAYLALDRAVKHDRLGVHQAMLQLIGLWEQKRLVATPQMLPLLDRVAGNEAFMNMSRERAAWLAAAIRAKSKAE